MNDTEPLPDRLIALGLIPAWVAGLCATDDQQFVEALIQGGHLTPFQAGQVLRGRGHHLAVGRYIILDRIGRGGMGQVFRVRHRHFGTLAALKVGRLERHKCEDAQRRFLREVRLASKFDHPNVTRALDSGPVRGTYYLVLEYVPGPDLGRVVCADGPLSPGAACEYARQAALGLAHMHERGVAHRDVKPANLGLADGDRTVKVFDFGLAVRIGRRSGVLKKFVGSADFVAPEQATDPCLIDPRSDVYGLGATLYFLLSGRLPYPGGTSIEKVQRLLKEPPPPLEEFRPELPTEVCTLVRRLMARDVADRIPSAAAAAAELARHAAPGTAPASVAGESPACAATVVDPSTSSVSR